MRYLVSINERFFCLIFIEQTKKMCKNMNRCYWVVQVDGKIEKYLGK